MMIAIGIAITAAVAVGGITMMNKSDGSAQLTSTAGDTPSDTTTPSSLRLS